MSSQFAILGSYSLIGQVINVPVDVDEMVRVLPRGLDDDYAFNVCFKKHTIHKSTYLSGFVKKSVVYAWLEFLVNSTLYKREGIQFDKERLRMLGTEQTPEEDLPQLEVIENEAEMLTGQQHTLIWNEDMSLELCPAMNRVPTSIMYDESAEELAFPEIYLGEPRRFREGVRATAFNKASSEAKRADRRGAKPDHVLYMAAKVIRYRAIEGTRNTFKSIGTANVTRAQLSDPDYVQSLLDQNLSFMRSIPNSVQYWQHRKQDLFAMIRQLGKPTMFLTLSADEPRWPNLLVALHKLSSDYDDTELADPLQELSALQRATLVNEDPVTCAAYFNKLVDVIMYILSSPKYSPFGKYSVVDHFKRIEFQQRGSAHAHIMLWCANDPREKVSEDMPGTVELIKTLCSIDADHWLGPLLDNKQKHDHTSTCYKHNDKRCRFNIPYWPMNRDRILQPLPTGDSRRAELKKRALEFRQILESKSFETLEEYLADCECTEEYYFDAIRAWLQRSSFFFKRTMKQLWTNPFNPWIAKILRSNMDLQFILDVISCACYLVDYVNKTNRGISALHRDLIEMQEQYPDLDYPSLLKKVCLKMLNSVEMCAQEAAWFLLRLPMSEASRKIEFLPTMMPDQRIRSRKQFKQMDEEGLDDESTDVWTKNTIQKYEDREGMDDVCLADFAAWYTKTRGENTYKRRRFPRVLRWRNYNMSELVDYKRESVLLFLPFRNEEADIMNRNRFLQLYDSHESELLAKRKEYDCELNLEQAVEEYLRIIAEQDAGEQEKAATERHVECIRTMNMQPNDDDIENLPTTALRAIVKQRPNVMPHADFCAMVRKTNAKQRDLILHIIHRMISYEEGQKPMQIFLTGPAGSGKTFVLRIVMETYNRYSQAHNSRNNAYVVCASTGKAAVNLEGITCHRAYRITISRQRSSKLNAEWLHLYQHEFRNVKVQIIDEVSMIGAHTLNTIHTRLQDIFMNYDDFFGGSDMILTGDLRQLPPVNAKPIFKPPTNTLGGALLWHSMELFELVEVMRQADVVFSNILTTIGDGDKLTAEQIKLIEARFRSVEWCQEHVPNAVRLFHQNADVDRFNNEALSGLEGHDCVAEDVITGYKDATQLASARGKLHKMSTPQTSGLPYIVRLCIGKQYMITTGIDGDDNLVNGEIGELKYIEMREDDSGVEKIYRLWFKFEKARIGPDARNKAKAIVDARPGILQHDWTPIVKQHVNITLGSNIKCKRIQFPIASACSMTIHKSQGGTFPEVVYNYSKDQENKLVYVALSRVTSLDGLYLTTSKNSEDSFKFLHGKGCNSPAMRELRDERKRARQHPLRTIGDELREIIEHSGEASTVFSINVQSLKAHHLDISTDNILTSVDYLALSETWIDDNSSVEIEGYTCIVQSKRDGARSGGVAIYQKTTSSTMAVPYTLELVSEERDEQFGVADKYGDICAAEVAVMGIEVLLVSMYIAPKTTTNQKKWFLARKLLQTSEKGMPMVVTGDFNLDVSKPDCSEFLEFMRENFGLKLANDVRKTTTKNGTVLDLTFIRNMTAEVTRFVSYFSYHRPILSVIRPQAPEPSQSY